MRAKDLTENPEIELANRLPSLKNKDRTTISDLIDRVAHRHRLSNKALHKLFIRKYNRDPFNWADHNLDEANTIDSRQSKIDDFIKWSLDTLNIQKPYPDIELSEESDAAQDGHHTGVNMPDANKIWIYIGNRNLVDCFRTIFHELVHTRQHQLGMIKPGVSYPGSPVEVLADAMAGKYIKIYTKDHPESIE